MEKEYLCTLHKQHDCAYADYNHRLCRLKIKDGFASCSCEYRIEAVVLAAAEPEESPENVVQQPQAVNPSGNADGTSPVG